METNIRPYGPGKFTTILDSYVYFVLLDGGCDDEISEKYSHWYGLMRNGRTIFRDHDPFLESLNESEQAILTDCAGLVLYQNSQGFVSVEYYDTNQELNARWEEIELAHLDSEDEDDSETQEVN